MLNDIRIIDATLREGSQAPGVLFTPEQSCVIAMLLARVGVDMIECGHAFVSQLERDRIRSVLKLDLGVPILSHARARIEDIDSVVETGAQWVGIFAGVNDISRDTKFAGRSQKEVVDMVLYSIDHAKRRGLKVRYTVEDASRTPIEIVCRIFENAVAAGADRICFADTLGVMSPDTMGQSIRAIRSALPQCAIEIHVHDDRGLAMASVLKGAENGADWISTSVNGIGERCGIPDLALLLANVNFATGARDWTDFGALQELAVYVGAITREPPDARRPVIGKYAFTHTAKLHTDAVIKNEMAYSWRRPQLLGRSLSFAARPQDGMERLVAKAQAICATELKYHRSGPGTRYVMIDDRFVENAMQYCIVREIPYQATRPAAHIDLHRHNVDSVFLFIGKGEGLKGLKAEVTLEQEKFVLESPASVLIPGGVLHSYSIIEGEGYYLNLVNEGAYHKSLLETHEFIKGLEEAEKEKLRNQLAHPQLLSSSASNNGNHPGNAAVTNGSVSFEKFTGAIAEFIARKSGLDAAQIHPDFDYFNSGILDSISTIELFFFIEEQFGQEFMPQEFNMAEMNTAKTLYQRFIRMQDGRTAQKNAYV